MVNVLNPLETEFPHLTQLEMNELCGGSYTSRIADSIISDIRYYIKYYVIIYLFHYFFILAVRKLRTLTWTSTPIIPPPRLPLLLFEVFSVKIILYIKLKKGYTMIQKVLPNSGYVLRQHGVPQGPARGWADIWRVLHPPAAVPEPRTPCNILIIPGKAYYLVLELISI